MLVQEGNSSSAPTALWNNFVAALKVDGIEAKIDDNDKRAIQMALAFVGFDEKKTKMSIFLKNVVRVLTDATEEQRKGYREFCQQNRALIIYLQRKILNRASLEAL